MALSLPSFQILLLEAGEEAEADHPFRGTENRFVALTPAGRKHDFGYVTEPQPYLGSRVIPYARGKALGGSSLTNFMVWTVGPAGDYDRWAEMVGDDSWRWENVKGVYKEV